ncbi:unnamed protein product, partial [marine sediment metagenome]
KLKKCVLATFYGRDSLRKRTAIYKCMDTAFPTLMQRCRQVKSEGGRHLTEDKFHAYLAHLAQRVESDFVFGKCIDRLRREYPALFVTTIHDSIMTTEDNGELVQGIMLDEFAKLNVHPTVRLEKC